MRSVSISVTEAARNFADCINRARYQGTSFILHKNGMAVARIVPEGGTGSKHEAAGKTAESMPDADGLDLEPARRASIPQIW